MKIICVGLGRTGTMSMQAAFESLGYKVLHYTKAGIWKQQDQK